jgi:inhibitor of cysteine peptidase
MGSIALVQPAQPILKARRQPPFGGVFRNILILFLSCRDKLRFISCKRRKSLDKIGKKEKNMENSPKNKRILWGIVPLLVLTMILGACASPDTEAANLPTTEADNGENSTMPRLDNTTNSIRVELIDDELSAQKHITKDITIELSGSLIVTLASNPSTGFGWQEAVIGDTAMMSQYSRQFVEPPMMMPGAAGKDVWTFKTLKAGTTTLAFGYSRPWQGGEQNEWTVTLNITVK